MSTLEAQENPMLLLMAIITIYMYILASYIDFASCFEEVVLDQVYLLRGGANGVGTAVWNC